jgi:hypothetical protein
MSSLKEANRLLTQQMSRQQASHQPPPGDSSQVSLRCKDVVDGPVSRTRTAVTAIVSYPHRFDVLFAPFQMPGHAGVV